jgi:hypothetical protein
MKGHSFIQELTFGSSAVSVLSVTASMDAKLRKGTNEEAKRL